LRASVRPGLFLRKIGSEAKALRKSLRSRPMAEDDQRIRSRAVTFDEEKKNEEGGYSSYDYRGKGRKTLRGREGDRESQSA